MEREQSESLFCVFCDFCVQPKYAQIHVIRRRLIINVISQMKQFTFGSFTWPVRTYGARPQSIKISQLNVREIKDDRTFVPAKCTFLQFRKNLFHLYNLLINNYWHTEFTEYTERRTHFVCARFSHAKIISVNFSSGWSESKANRNSVCSVTSVCHLNMRDTRDTWKQIINWLHRFHRYHAAII